MNLERPAIKEVVSVSRNLFSLINNIKKQATVTPPSGRGGSSQEILGVRKLVEALKVAASRDNHRRPMFLKTRVFNLIFKAFYTQKQ